MGRKRKHEIDAVEVGSAPSPSSSSPEVDGSSSGEDLNKNVETKEKPEIVESPKEQKEIPNVEKNVEKKESNGVKEYRPREKKVQRIILGLPTFKRRG